MKNILNVSIFALIISLSFSVTKNYSLLREISAMYDYMTFSAEVIKMKNDESEKYHWNKSKILKNSLFNFNAKSELFTEEGTLVEEYFEKINKQESSTIRFYLEQERTSKLNGINPMLNEHFFKSKDMQAKLDFADELYLGFYETIFDNAIFEISINGVEQNYSGSGVYKCPITPKVLIDLKKISINPENQNLDTICISRLITRA